MERTRIDGHALAIMGMAMMMGEDLYGSGNPYGYNGKYDRDDGVQMSANEVVAANLRQEKKIEAARLKRLKKNTTRLKNRQC